MSIAFIPALLDVVSIVIMTQDTDDTVSCTCVAFNFRVAHLALVTSDGDISVREMREHGWDVEMEDGVQ